MVEVKSRGSELPEASCPIASLLLVCKKKLDFVDGMYCFSSSSRVSLELDNLVNLTEFFTIQ